MNVAQLMNRNVETCGPDDSLAIAAVKMWDRDVGSLPVIDREGHVLGAVTDRDICMTACFRGQPLHEIDVSAAMSNQVHACRPEDALIEAEEIHACPAASPVAGGRRGGRALRRHHHQ